MERNYLLRVIERNFFILSKDEISKQIKGDIFFDESLKKLIIAQDESLNDQEKLPTHNVDFRKTCTTMLTFVERGIDYMQVADTSLLAISVYYHYTAVCFPSAIFELIRVILKEKILLV